MRRLRRSTVGRCDVQRTKVNKCRQGQDPRARRVESERQAGLGSTGTDDDDDSVLGGASAELCHDLPELLYSFSCRCARHCFLLIPHFSGHRPCRALLFYRLDALYIPQSLSATPTAIMPLINNPLPSSMKSKSRPVYLAFSSASDTLQANARRLERFSPPSSTRNSPSVPTRSSHLKSSQMQKVSPS